MDKKTSLQYLGLSEKEARVYLVLIELGTTTAPMIAKKSGVKRPTVYVLLDELRKQDLVTVIPKRSKTLYVANSPKILTDARREQNEEIAEMMPEILAVYNNRESKPRVRFFEGEKEVLNLYHKEIFQEKEILFVSSIGLIPKSILESITRHMVRVKGGELSIREIHEDTPASRALYKKYRCSHYVVKTAPNNFRLPTDNAIFGNKVALFSYKDVSNPIAVVIESEDVAETYRSLFELAWRGIGGV